MRLGNYPSTVWLPTQRLYVHIYGDSSWNNILHLKKRLWCFHMSKAIDFVKHSFLYNKHLQQGLPFIVVRFILITCHQIANVKWNHEFSDFLNIQNGVKQCVAFLQYSIVCIPMDFSWNCVGKTSGVELGKITLALSDTPMIHS